MKRIRKKKIRKGTEERKEMREQGNMERGWRKIEKRGVLKIYERRERKSIGEG